MATVGVSVIKTTTGAGATPSAGNSAFMVACTPRGPEGIAIPCTSFSEFQNIFGGLDTLIDAANNKWGVETNDAVVQGFYAAKSFFTEAAGAPAVLYVVRAVNTHSATHINDAYGAASGSFTDGYAHNTTITSKWCGIQGEAVSITITNPSPDMPQNVDNSQNNYVSYAVPTYAQIKVSFQRTGSTEIWNISNAQEAASASQKSKFVNITLPGGGQLPQTCTATYLSGAIADAFDATDSDFVGATTATGAKYGLEAFRQELGGGIVMIPGKYSATVRSGLATHGATYRRMAYLGCASGLDLSSASTDFTVVGEEVDCFVPRVWVADVSGGKVLIDPVGPVVGNQFRMDAEFGGVQKSAGGPTHTFLSVLDVERTANGNEIYDDAATNTLADSNINTIRLKQGGGIYVRGLRTRALNNFWRQSPVKRIGLKVELIAQAILDNIVQEPIDSKGNTFSHVQSQLGAAMRQMLAAGELFGTMPGNSPKDTDAFKVICDLSNNPASDIFAGILRCGLSYSPTPSAEQVILNLEARVPGASQ